MDSKFVWVRDRAHWNTLNKFTSQKNISFVYKLSSLFPSIWAILCELPKLIGS